MALNREKLKKWSLPFLMILSGILYVITIVSAYGGYFNPDNWTIPAIAVLFFPYLAMGTLVVSAVWIICRRYVEGCIGLAVVLACGPTFLDAMPFRFAREASGNSRSFKMVTFNCLHLKDQENPDPDYNRSLSFIINSGADFVCLQELYLFGYPEIPVKYDNQLDSLFELYPYVSTDRSKEIEFASKYPFEQLDVHLGEDVKYGSCGAYKIKFDNDSLTIINIHLPSYLLSEDERNIITEAKNQEGVNKSLKELEGSVYKKLRNAFRERAKVSKAIAEYARDVEGNVIVCGDFNDVPGSWAYRNFTKREFNDAYAQTGFGHIITYNQHLMWFHIDQILYKGGIVPLYVRKEKLSASDHYPLVAEFEFI